MNKIIKIALPIIMISSLVASCVNNINESSYNTNQQIDGIYKELDGSKWIEFNKGYFSYYYEAQNHMPLFDCHRLSFGKFKFKEDKFIELNSSDSILHTRSLIDYEVKKANLGNQDSIYVRIKKTKQDGNLDYTLSYIYDEIPFSRKNYIQIKKSDDDFGLLEVKIRPLNYPNLYNDGRYKGLTDINVVVNMENFNYFEIDLSVFTECLLNQEYYKEEFIHYSQDKIFWNGRTFLKTKQATKTPLHESEHTKFIK